MERKRTSKITNCNNRKRGDMEYLNSRLTKIFDILAEKDRYVTSNDLSSLTKVSVRTIKKDIAELSEYLSKYDVVILSKPGQGYFLKKNDMLLYTQLLQAIKKRDTATNTEIPKYRYERVNYIIKKMLSVDYYLTLEDLMDELYVSRSTITADMKEVREVFKDYRLDVVNRPNYGIILEGDEIAKRICIAEYFFHNNISTGYFAADNAMFVSTTNQEEIDFVRNKLISINEALQIRMSDLSFQNFVIHILIAIRRWKFYGYVKQDSDRIREIDKTCREYQAASMLVKGLTEHLNILLPESEVFYFALHFKSKHIAEIDEINFEAIETVEKTFYTMYHSLQHNYAYIVKNKQIYEEYLRLHIPAMVSRLRSGLVMRNPQIFEIITKYLCSVHLTIVLSKIIEDNFDVSMNYNEFAYLVLYTNLLFDFKNNKDEKILLVCGRGRPETITLLNELNESNLQVSSNIELCDAIDIESKDIGKYDLVASTVPIQKELGIKYEYLENDLCYSQDLIRIIKNHRLSYDKVSKYFNKKHFQFDSKSTARDEVFESVANYLGKQSLAKKFWEAEHMISHETTKGVVFLHTIEPLHESFVQLTILSKPIIWNKQWIQMVG